MTLDAQLRSAKALVLALAAASLALVAGCGADKSEPKKTGFGAADVQRSFAAVGVQLTPARRGGFVVYQPAKTGGTQVVSSTSNRYGEFSVYLLHGRGGRASREFAFTPAGKPISATSDGVYWRSTQEFPPTWQAAKRFGNAVLVWKPEPGIRSGRTPRRLGAEWRRLVAVMATLGKTTTEIKAALPAARPCAERSIDLASGPAGTCRLGHQVLTVANAPGPLVLDGMTVKKLRVRTATSLTSRFTVTNITGDAIQRGPWTEHAKGVFAVVSFNVTNSGSSPIELLQPQLSTGSRQLAPIPNSDTLTLPTPKSPFPLRPGRSTRWSAVYDVPSKAGLAHAVAVFPGDPSSPVVSGYVGTLGAIRLEGLRA